MTVDFPLLRLMQSLLFVLVAVKKENSGRCPLQNFFGSNFDLL